MARSQSNSAFDRGGSLVVLLVSAGVIIGTGALVVRAGWPQVQERFAAAPQAPQAPQAPSALAPPQLQPAPAPDAGPAPLATVEAAAQPELLAAAVEEYVPPVPKVAGPRGAYVRPTPALDRPPLAQVSPGGALRITGRVWVGDTYWYRVSLDRGRTGFVRNDATHEKSLEPEPAADATAAAPASGRSGPAAAAAIPQPGFIRNHLVEWERRATAQQLREVYPRIAFRNGEGASVELTCVVQPNGGLGECRSERPGAVGPDFTSAALKLVRRFRMDTTLKDGTSAVGRPYRLTVAFDPPRR